MRCGANGLRSARWRCFGAALQAFAAACESLNQDRRNAERYDNTAQALQGSGERLDIRLGIAAGSTSVLGEYVAAVQDQLNRLARCRRHPWRPDLPQLSYQHVVKLSPAPPPAGVDN